MKNVSIQNTKIIVRHALKLYLHRDASRATQCSRMLNTQLPRVIAKCAIRLSSSNGWGKFLPEPMKFLVDMPIHAH